VDETGTADTSAYLTKIAAAREEAQALFEITNEIGSSLSLHDTLSMAAVRLKRMAPFDALAAYIVREKLLIPEFVTGDEFRFLSSLEIPVGRGISGWVAENRKAIVNGDPAMESRYPGGPEDAIRLRSALAVPLQGVSGVVAVLALYHRDGEAFTRDHLRILQAVSGKLALCVENALRYRQAESSSAVDYLTELPNARSLFLHLDAELARCRRSGEALAVLACDLDGFKQVNDRFGYLEGNRILKTVARKLVEVCREYDYVARMGGDEFVLVLPGLKPDDVRGTLERLAFAGEEAARQAGSDASLSLSIGEAHFPADGTDAEELLATADRRMYQAKESRKAGRGRQTPPRIGNPF
jgi:diguanylate cyclase (GGDEF)-like protein